MFVLCETCFPTWAEVEVLSIVPMLPCHECGTFKNVHAFQRDLRVGARSSVDIPANED